MSLEGLPRHFNGLVQYATSVTLTTADAACLVILALEGPSCIYLCAAVLQVMAVEQNHIRRSDNYLCERLFYLESITSHQCGNWA